MEKELAVLSLSFSVLYSAAWPVIVAVSYVKNNVQSVAHYW